ncbi:YbaK/EbsC family protein [Candidatus Bathyarchaeota archaeon]|nr:YbaK/EbsC family protein [Candidatus Bathyarchaeota archaeon]MBT4321236.1 YbaK/EbsC family protein [Candidatus Bathyarchaeota archaeon]MBT4423611.1 YbaK/EbsC family protein [Candidatus Bathyarchaeota archaeon]MBT5642967.1 YbaK/EbsC family protein [Candidatus Bathyarchaeota archaeon]MBT6604996.1 YbaK/EbsC family protein [Candidatus Bathyarchaeota archaeon]
MVENGVKAEVISFTHSTHSVAEAAAAVGAEPEDFVKSICMVTMGGKLVVAIVKGEHRASTSRVGKALGIPRPRIAEPGEILELTGYPVGGTPAFGYEATFLMDPKVLEKEKVYSGGGSGNALTYTSTEEMKRVNGAKVARLRS